MTKEILTNLDNPEDIADLKTQILGLLDAKLQDQNKVLAIPDNTAGKIQGITKQIQEVETSKAKVLTANSIDALVNVILTMNVRSMGQQEQDVRSIFRQLSLKKLFVYRQRSPEYVEEIRNLLSKPVSVQSLSEIINIIDNRIKDHVLNIQQNNTDQYWTQETFDLLKNTKKVNYINDYFLTHLNPLRTTLANLKKLDLQSNLSIEMIPDKGIIGEMAGYCGGVCYTKVFPLLSTNPNLTPYKFVTTDPINGNKELIGSALVFEVDMTDGQKAYVIRAYDVRDEASMDIGIFFEKFADHLMEVGKSNGISKVLVAGTGGTVSNYPIITNYVISHYVQEKSYTPLKETFDFNGNDITNHIYEVRSLNQPSPALPALPAIAFGVGANIGGNAMTQFISTLTSQATTLGATFAQNWLVPLTPMINPVLIQNVQFWIMGIKANLDIPFITPSPTTKSNQNLRKAPTTQIHTNESKPRSLKPVTQLATTNDHVNLLSHLTQQSPNTILQRLVGFGINILSKFTGGESATSVLYRLGGMEGIAGRSGQYSLVKHYALSYSRDVNQLALALRAQIEGFTTLLQELEDNQYIYNPQTRKLSKVAKGMTINRTIRLYLPPDKYIDVPLSALVAHKDNDEFIEQLAKTLITKDENMSFINDLGLQPLIISMSDWSIDPDNPPLGSLSFSHDNLHTESQHLYDPNLGVSSVIQFDKNNQITDLHQYHAHVIFGIPALAMLNATDQYLQDKKAVTPAHNIFPNEVHSSIQPITEMGLSLVAQKNTATNLASLPKKDPLLASATALAQLTNIRQVVHSLRVDDYFLRLWMDFRTVYEKQNKEKFPFSEIHKIAISQTIAEPWNPGPIGFIVATDPEKNNMNIAIAGGMSYALLSRGAHGHHTLSPTHLNAYLKYINSLAKLQTDSRELNNSTISYMLSMLGANKDIGLAIARRLLGSVSEPTANRTQFSYLGNDLGNTTFETSNPGDTTSYAFGLIGNNLTIKNNNDPYLWAESSLEYLLINPLERNKFNIALGKISRDQTSSYSKKSLALVRKLISMDHQKSASEYHHLVSVGYLKASDQKLVDEITQLINLASADTLKENEAMIETLRQKYLKNTEVMAYHYLENLYTTTLYLSRNYSNTRNEELENSYSYLSDVLVKIKEKIAALQGTTYQVPKPESLYSKVISPALPAIAFDAASAFTSSLSTIPLIGLLPSINHTLIYNIHTWVSNLNLVPKYFQNLLGGVERPFDLQLP